jgi:ABC-type multidrug transport system fused ATPase/permease subunit
MTTVLTVVAMVLNSWLLALPLLVSMPLVWFSTRRYLARAPQGYITEGGTYSRINTSLTETIEGARTVEALGLQGRRVQVGDDDIAVSSQAERYTMALRNLLFGALGIAFDSPLVMVLVVGAFGYGDGLVTLGQITAATLYVQALVEPLQRLIRNMDRLQVGVASTARLLGIASVPQDREAGDELPLGNHLVGRDLRFAYREGHDVLHGVDLDLRPGERLAIVGLSGAGKSTLGRLLAGVDRPRTGTVTVGGVPIADLPPDVLRRQVVLVTQEHHVFRESLRDNLMVDAPDDAMRRALKTVGADWAVADGAGDLDRDLGEAPPDGAQAQQLALARVVLADPHTVILDEATALLDPTAARTAERALAAVLHDRTVIAIAHRLQTAHDADRVAVMDDGRIIELGTHDELVAAGGPYAALWRSWQS